MKKFLTVALLLAAYCAGAQDVYNRYAMKLSPDGQGGYTLPYKAKYEKIIDLSQVPDLLVPYNYKEHRTISAKEYTGAETREMVYKTYPDYELKLIVDMAKSDSPAPFMVFIHGGGWARGDNGTNRDVSGYLALKHGITGVRIAYTLAPQPGANINVTIQDVRDAVKFIQNHAKELNIDPTRFGFMGGSAGAHLSAVGAMGIPGAKVLVGCSGIYDLTSAAISVKAKEQERIKYFLDKDPKVLHDASPIYMIPKKDIPAVLMQCGTGDIVVEWQQSQMFADALNAAGAKNVVLKIYPFYDHNLNATSSDLKEPIFRESVDFIVKNIF